MHASASVIAYRSSACVCRPLCEAPAAKLPGPTYLHAQLHSVVSSKQCVTSESADLLLTTYTVTSGCVTHSGTATPPACQTPISVLTKSAPGGARKATRSPRANAFSPRMRSPTARAPG
eukprot:scaffold101144_cov63-Phaeocystis_antarctica.AAC.4